MYTYGCLSLNQHWWCDWQMREWYLEPTIICDLLVVWWEPLSYGISNINAAIFVYRPNTSRGNDKYYVIHTMQWAKERKDRTLTLHYHHVDWKLKWSPRTVFASYLYVDRICSLSLALSLSLSILPSSGLKLVSVKFFLPLSFCTMFVQRSTSA